MRTDGRTDIAKQIVDFRNFEKAPKKGGILRADKSRTGEECGGRTNGLVQVTTPACATGRKRFQIGSSCSARGV
jgi:hypothetical protein